MQAYQSILPELRALGATLAAVSPQLPDGSLTMAERNALEFEVLSDLGNAVARRFGIVWRYPQELKDVYLSFFDNDLSLVNGDDSWELPVPATFVIGPDGVIRYGFVDPDYTRRAEPAAILEAVRSV